MQTQSRRSIQCDVVAPVLTKSLPPSAPSLAFAATAGPVLLIASVAPELLFDAIFLSAILSGSCCGAVVGCLGCARSLHTCSYCFLDWDVAVCGRSPPGSFLLTPHRHRHRAPRAAPHRTAPHRIGYPRVRRRAVTELVETNDCR